MLMLWWVFSAKGTVQRHLATHAPVVYDENPGTLVIDLKDGSNDAVLQQIAQLLSVPVRWVHPLSRDESLALAEGKWPLRHCWKKIQWLKWSSPVFLNRF